MTAVSVDPRLRARRVAVQREAGRRRLRRLLVVLGLTALVVAAYGIARSPLLDVDDVSYVGLDQTPLAAVLDASGIDVGTSLVSVDTGAVEDRLEALPWIDTAHVERSWTGRVTIEVTEREAVAAAMVEQDRWVLVDGTGRILTGVVNVDPDLPKLSGIAAAGAPGTSLAPDAAAVLEVARLLPDRLRGRVDGVYLDELGDIWLSLKTADRVVLGAPRDLAVKVVVLSTALEQLEASGRTGFELDVSVPTLSVVRDLRPELRPIGGREGG